MLPEFGAGLRRFVFETVLMIDRQALQRCPLLAAAMNKLPLVFANCATRRRFDSRAKLRSALHTDEVLHWERVMGQDGACPSNFWLEGRPLCRPTIVRQSAKTTGQLIPVPNRTGAGDMFLDPLRVAGIGNFSRAGDGNFQCFAGPNLGVRRARGGDFGGFGLKSARI